MLLPLDFKEPLEAHKEVYTNILLKEKSLEAYCTKIRHFRMKKRL